MKANSPAKGWQRRVRNGFNHVSYPKCFVQHRELKKEKNPTTHEDGEVAWNLEAKQVNLASIGHSSYK
jgi:hypothetical protein